LPDASSRVDSLLSKQPNDLRLLMLSGMIYDKMGQFTKARDAYEKLLSLRPDFEAALNNLAWLYAEKLNELDKPTTWLGKRGRWSPVRHPSRTLSAGYLISGRTTHRRWTY
jgi:Tfp pilus assembly protein PilF